MSQEFIPSAQQQAFFDWIDTGTGSAELEAVAGAGKTTTLVQACLRIPATQSIAFTAYNKKIADEIKSRVTANTNVKAGTFHSFGNGALYRALGKTRVSDYKVRDLCRTEVRNDETGKHEPMVSEKLEGFVAALVSLAKNHAIGFLKPIEDRDAWWELVNHHDLDEKIEGATEDKISEGISLAQAILAQSTDMARQHKVIDFDDMIYLPLVMDLKLWQHDWLFVDEAQDTNPARRALAKKMLRVGGRAVFVGDPHQAIYGFTGADSDAMDIIAAEFNTIKLPLTVTYRCPKSVVDVAREFVSHITAHETAPQGSVTSVERAGLAVMSERELGSGSVVLCRNTKPLVELAYNFIRRGVPCHVEGKDIGRGLLALIGKWKVTELSELADKLEDYRDRETQKLMAKGEELKAAAVSDKVETVLVLMENVGTIAELRAVITRMFEDTTGPQTRLTLSTIHKAKGREWNRVFWLGREKYQPSGFARQAWQMAQEVNLMYVAATRAKQELVLVYCGEKARRSGPQLTGVEA